MRLFFKLIGRNCNGKVGCAEREHPMFAVLRFDSNKKKAMQSRRNAAAGIKNIFLFKITICFDVELDSGEQYERKKEVLETSKNHLKCSFKRTYVD